VDAVKLAAIVVGWAAYAVRPPVVHTRTVTVTRTAPPKVIHKTRWRTRTVTVPGGYNPAETNCIVNLFHSYVALADGGPAGDSSLFQYDCPGVHINGLTP
jgi:hypothetical protein